MRPSHVTSSDQLCIDLIHLKTNAYSDRLGPKRLSIERQKGYQTAPSRTPYDKQPLNKLNFKTPTITKNRLFRWNIPQNNWQKLEKWQRPSLVRQSRHFQKFPPKKKFQSVDLGENGASVRPRLLFKNNKNNSPVHITRVNLNLTCTFLSPSTLHTLKYRPS